MLRKRRIMLIIAASFLGAAIGAVPSLAVDDANVDAVEIAEVGGMPRDIEFTVWYQGFLADVDTGDPINGSVTIGARIYSASSGGTAVWGPEVHSGVTVTEGWFNIELGSSTSLPAFDDPPYYLDLTVNGETMDARMKLASVPMAYHVESIDLPAAMHQAVSGSGAFGIYVDDPAQSTSGIYCYHAGTGSAITGYSESSGPAIRGNANGTGPAGEFNGELEVNGELLVQGPYVGLGTLSPNAYLKVTTPGAAPLGQAISFESTTALGLNNDMFEVVAPEGSSTTCQLIEAQVGTNVKFKVNADGQVTADGSFTGGGADFAEMIRAGSGAVAVEAGDVLVIDATSPRSVVKCFEANSSLVAGVYSSEPGFVGSIREWDVEMGDAESRPLTRADMASQYDEVPMAVVGIVPCKVSAENGPVAIGDLLVTSGTPGHAMRSGNPRAGTILGKALEELPFGTGVIEVLVTLQ